MVLREQDLGTVAGMASKVGAVTAKEDIVLVRRTLDKVARTGRRRGVDIEALVELVYHVFFYCTHAFLVSYIYPEGYDIMRKEYWVGCIIYVEWTVMDAEEIYSHL